MRSIMILFFFLVFVGQTARAQFVLNKDYCFISNDFTFTDSNNEVMASFQMAFSAEPVTIPVINLSFSTGFSPDKISLSWVDPQILNRNKNLLFTQKFTDYINKSKKEFPLYQNGSDVYYSPAYGFANSRIFLALLLSQNTMTLSYSKGSETKTVSINLTGSDQAVRDMGVNCYKGKTSEYLNEHGTRKKDLIISWENAYGLADYGVASDIFNEEINVSESFKKDIQKGYDFYQAALPVLVEKDVLMKDILAKEQTSTVSKTLDLIKQKMTEVQTASSRVMMLSSSGMEKGQIQKIEADLLTLKSKKLEIEAQISALMQNEITGKEKSLNTIKEMNSRHEAEISKFDGQIKELNTTITGADQNLVYLNSMYDFVTTKISEKDLELALNKETNGAPLSFDEIKSRSEKITEDEIEIETLNRTLISLQDIKQDLEKTVSNYKKTFADYEKFVNLQKQITIQDHAIEVNQVTIYKIKEENFNLDNQDLIKYNKKIETIINVKDRTVGEDKAKIIELLKVKNSELDAQIDKFKAEGFTVASMVACKTSYFTDKSLFCLTPLQLTAEKDLIYFFDQTTSEKIDELIVAAQLDYYYPWKHPNNKNKTDVLIEKLNAELKESNIVEIQDIWKTLLMLRWRYNFLKVEKDESKRIGSKYYEDQAKALQDKLNKLAQDIKSEQTEKDRLFQELNSFKSVYLASESEFSTQSTQFVSRILQVVTDLSIEKFSVKDCLLDTFEILNCESQFNNYVEAIGKTKADKETVYNQDLQILATNIVSQQGHLTTVRQQSSDSVVSLTASRDEYEIKNEVAKLRAEQNVVQTEFNALLEKHKKLEQDKASMLSQEQQFNSDKLNYQNEVESLKSLIMRVNIELEPLKKEVEGFCAEQNQMYKNLEQIDKKLMDLGASEMMLEKLSVSPCQALQSMILR